MYVIMSSNFCGIDTKNAQVWLILVLVGHSNVQVEV